MIDVGKKKLISLPSFVQFHAYHFHFRILRSCSQNDFVGLCSNVYQIVASCNCIPLAWHSTANIGQRMTVSVFLVCFFCFVLCALCLICCQLFKRMAKMLLKTRFNWALTPWLRFIICSAYELTQLVAVANKCRQICIFRYFFSFDFLLF